jgi:hypothetical protein
MERAAELSPAPEEQARRLVAAASAAVPTGQADWVGELTSRALAVTADPELRLTARHDAGWALAYSGRPTTALPALISVAEEASRDQPALAWDALSDAAIVVYHSGALASRKTVSRFSGSWKSGVLRWRPGWRAEVGSHRLWIRACLDPFGGRGQLVDSLRQVSGSSLDEPALWRVGSAAWLLDESDLAITLLQEAMQRLRAPGTQGTSAPGLTALGWAYIDVGRWDEAQEAAAEAADLAEANQMEIVAASADVDRGHRPRPPGRLRRGPQACRPGARHRRSGRKRTDSRPGPAGPRRRRPRRRQLPACLQPAPPAVQRGRRACPQHLLLPGRGRSRRCRGPRRPADGGTRRP